ncbi:MAG: dipeptide ABC transporter ATP-binding protein [Actinomycetes bacterium]
MNDEIILQAQDLIKHFPTGASRLLQRPTQVVQAVDGVSFSLRRGTTLAIVGESGCGKSTLARLLARLIEPTSGSVILNGTNITSASPKQMLRMRRDIQVVFQDPYACLNPRHSIGQSIGTPIRIQKTMNRSDERHRVFELMELVGLSHEHYNRFPHEFSGGQRQRAGIARALALQPKVIVADEPVSALDVSIQAQILNLLEKLQTELELSYVFIAHDLSVVRHIADEVAVMYLGKIVEIGSPKAVYGAPAHPYTQALMSAVPVPNPQAAANRKRIILVGDVPSPIDPPSGCRFRTRCPRAQDLCALEEPALIDRGHGHPVACHFPD